MEGTTLWIQAGSLGGVTVNHVRGDLSLQIPCLALETNLADGSLLLMDGGFSLWRLTVLALPPQLEARLESERDISLSSRYPSPTTDLDEIVAVIP